jgi:hypothetical protein
MYDDPIASYHGPVHRSATKVHRMENNGAVPDPAARLTWLRTEHRDLDAAIDSLERGLASDQLQLARLKKRKLRLKDEIAKLEDALVPDIIA